MEATFWDGLSYFIRWAHVIAGIAWIGNSFYFMWLDSNLERPHPPKPGVEGSLWMVHSGGFYQVEKRKVRPHEIPPTLHWFYWEATLTWITGFFLLGILYYWQANSFLIDPSVLPLGRFQAILISLTLLVGSWFLYDLLWQSPLRKHSKAATGASLGLGTLLIFGLCHLFSGRGAFIHLGAILGTLMVTNVWVRILPAQRKMIEATQKGLTPDYDLGKKAKTRSIHNSYMTLPVLLTMLSNHAANTFGNSQNWLVLMLLCALGMTVRHLMISKNQKRPLFKPALASIFFLIVCGGVSFTHHTSPYENGQGPPAFATVRSIVETRCQSCHSAQPSDDVFRSPPRGVVFDSPQSLRTYSKQIKTMVVQTKTMPLANKTGMTDDERVLIDRWLEGGAPGP